MNNPILDADKLPAFDQIEAHHVEPAIKQLLQDNRQAVADLIASNPENDWAATAGLLEDIDDRLNRAWSPVSHLHSVADNEALREAYNACLPLLSDYATEMGQNRGLYLLYKNLADSAAYGDLSQAQKTIIDHALRDFRLSGIDLPAAEQQEYKTLQLELSQLQTKFQENVLDATQAYQKHITDAAQLGGLPESALALANQAAQQAGLEGWLFTLDFPSYFPVMSYADNRELRQEMYQAYVTRASEQTTDQAQWDNSDIIEKILAGRYRLARLLGFDSYAHRSLATKMASTPKEVIDFLDDLAQHSKPIAEQEFQQLQAFAQEQHGVTDLAAWDVAYYSEKQKQHEYDFSQEQLRPYFPVNQVLAGMFSVVEKLYGLKIKATDEVATWHEDVQFFAITDQEGELRGSFYLDLFARKQKRGGAWMDECLVRRNTSTGLQHPVAYLTCNFTPPIGDDPSLLTHDEVTTLFHEFGHGLHHMLTKIDYAGVSGINGVAWDAVELPSQFMENWCWEREALSLIARHYQTGEALPESLFNKMLAAKNFQSGMQMVRQLEFALFDFRLHLEYKPETNFDVQALLNEVRDQVSVVIPPHYNRFQHSFSHIFAGGYAAGYYSYKWAEVLSADAFSKFEEEGIFNPETGSSFLQNILERGGSEDAMDLFVAFRGRKPSVDALLRHSGITSPS